MKTKSALSYFGSDSEVAPQLGAMFDNCKHVTIAMVGGASIIPYLKARAIVANDLHDLAINFYRVLSGWYGDDMRQQVIHRCQHTLSHPSDMELAQETIRRNVRDHAEKAWAFWTVCWLGRKGKGGTKNQAGMPSVRRTANGGTNASRVRAAANDLEEWAAHFERCEWQSVCFRKLLPEVADEESCGIYVDPPWVKAGKLYLHAFVERDHRDLRELLGRFTKTTIVIRYDNHPLIHELYSDWFILEASSRDQQNVVKEELWIMNRRPEGFVS